MTQRKIFKLLLMISILPVSLTLSQQRNYNPPPMDMNVGHFEMNMNPLMGDGGLQSQFSWDLTGSDAANTEIFYWPSDWYQSNMLYQIFNPLVLDTSGIKDENGKIDKMYTRGAALTNYGMTDWAYEVRRYRPPHVVVDGLRLDPPYQWYVDKNIPADEMIVFEDVLPQFGIRSHVEMYGFSNPNNADYFIWKATQKFTGEVKLPRNAATSKDTLPDQTIRFWWPIAFSFGPTKAGERAALGGFQFEGQDDLDSWFKRKSDLVPNGPRDSLAVAYYYDYRFSTTTKYTNGSNDDCGDPDRTTGFLYSTAVPGYTLLHADKSATDKSDDLSQPYAMPHASIETDLWGRRDVGLLQTYRGDDNRGRFPLDPITAGLATVPQKGPMRFITAGPYSLTKNSAAGEYDSLTFVYAVGVGGLGWEQADSIGFLWLKNQITDAVKDSLILKAGKDSLWKTLDRANWAWNRISNGGSVPTAPPPPDIDVTSGPNIITVHWSYPNSSYFLNTITGIDDWYEWRVYRKEGALLVNDPLDQNTGARWRLVYQTTDKNQTTFIDSSVIRGVDYYYAVTAVNNGTQNTDGIYPGEKLESSRFANRSQLPAVSVKPGLNVSNKVRVVPNPATVAAGKALTSGSPDKISFFNLPIKCTLRIFTETGDLVKTIQHYGTADEEWDQRTDNNQYVSSGIYVLAVTDCQDIHGKNLDNEFVKFILVR
ncbi:MAG TPA: hypothetical protein VJ954_08640 [Ignavibacteriaceae bacterium]|nr:hypothetical protein [Ignavibacteriaceae bacterium]